MGWVNIGLLGLMVAFNISVMMLDTFRNCKLKHAKKAKKNQGKKIEIEKDVQSGDSETNLLRNMYRDEKWQGLKLKSSKRIFRKQKMMSSIPEIPEVSTLQEA